MIRQLRVLSPLVFVGLFLLALPFLETTWKRYNPIAGAWPGNTITYWNGSEYDVSLREAFGRWEETDIGIKFQEVKDKKEADLVVFSDLEGLRERCTSSCSGWATIGYTPFRQAEMWLMPPSNPMENRIQDFVMMPTIIHEIGHVLGLKHTDDVCSVMNTADPSCRTLATARIMDDGRWMMCGPWENDLDRLRQLYPDVGEDFSGWCHDPVASWDFFVRHGSEVIRGLENFQEFTG